MVLWMSDIETAVVISIANLVEKRELLWDNVPVVFISVVAAQSGLSIHVCAKGSTFRAHRSFLYPTWLVVLVMEDSKMTSAANAVLCLILHSAWNSLTWEELDYACGSTKVFFSLSTDVKGGDSEDIKRTGF